MKKVLLLLLLLSFGLFISCEKSGSESFSTNLGGSTDLPMNEVGNTIYSTTIISGHRYTSNTQITVVKNEDGITTIHIKSKIPQDLPFANLVTSDMKDANGNLDIELKYKNSTEGVLDYTNIDHKPFVIAKYDAKVGDKYILKKSDGMTITRTVTKHSTTDDFEWIGGQWLYLKTVTVEQDSRIPGVDKIVYNANHKYGLVGIKVVMEDGTVSKFFFNSASY